MLLVYSNIEPGFYGGWQDGVRIIFWVALAWAGIWKFFSMIFLTFGFYVRSVEEPHDWPVWNSKVFMVTNDGWVHFIIFLLNFRVLDQSRYENLFFWRTFINFYLIDENIRNIDLIGKTFFTQPVPIPFYRTNKQWTCEIIRATRSQFGVNN